jgi:hypothetical protein
LASGAGAEAAALLGPAAEVLDVAEAVADAVLTAVADEQDRVAFEIGAALGADAEAQIGVALRVSGGGVEGRSGHRPRDDVLESAEDRAAARGDEAEPVVIADRHTAPGAGLAHAADDTRGF